MRSIEEIKEEVYVLTKDGGLTDDDELYIIANHEIVQIIIHQVAYLYARGVAKETQRLCAENATLMCGNLKCECHTSFECNNIIGIDKQSILSEYNIPSELK